MEPLNQSFLNTQMRTREEVVADALRAAIVRGSFKPGEKLDQQELADRFGISRSPLREALRTLAAEDLVVNIPHRGTVVAERSMAELEELVFMRCLLEGAAARRAAPLMDAQRLEKLASIIDEANQSTDIEHVLGLNNEFHTTICAAYEQPHLMAAVQQLRNKVSPYNRLYLELAGHKETAWTDHQRIFDACVARDGELAEAEMRQHLEQIFEGIRLAIKQ